MTQWQNHIHADQKVLLGKPVIKGTRISVELVLELLAADWSHEMILESYPTITAEDLKAVYLYLRECMELERYFPHPKMV